jgi:hypothetical protein
MKKAKAMRKKNLVHRQPTPTEKKILDRLAKLRRAQEEKGS